MKKMLFLPIHATKSTKMYTVLSTIKFCLKITSKIKFFAITLLPLILYFFSSLGPITNADSLDYHAGVAAYILNYGQYPDLKIWFHSIQAGAGEVLISLSFFLKSEQFASLIQFSGLISIFGSFYYLIKNYHFVVFHC